MMVTAPPARDTQEQTMDITTARRIADSLVDSRIYRSEQDIVDAHDAIDAVYGTPAADVRDLVRMSALRTVGQVA